MTASGFVKSAGALCALAILSACGGSAIAPSTTPLNATYVGKTLFLNGRPVTAARVAPAPSFMQLVPEKPRGAKDFEYIINDYGSYASIFTYPKSTNMWGKIDNVGGQGCTNALYGYGNGIIWIVAGPTQIQEFKVPKKLLKTYKVNYSFASSCAMDTAGDLAVGILYGSSEGGGGGGDVVIFKKGTTKGTGYKTALDEEFFDGYDNKGNLFADGFTGDRSGFALVELPAGSSKAIKLTTSNSPEFPGSVQWDGTYLTVFDQLTDEVYQYTIKGTKATLKHSVTLSGAGDCAQTWIATGVIYCGDAGNNVGEVYDYPKGGSPLATFTGSFDTPLGVTAAYK